MIYSYFISYTEKYMKMDTRDTKRAYIIKENFPIDDLGPIEEKLKKVGLWGGEVYEIEVHSLNFLHATEEQSDKKYLESWDV